jgi:NADH-quinone oxidoreductase subunit C
MATTEITTHTFNAESLLAQFPSVVTRPSLDHPSFNVPSTEILAVLSVLKSHYSFDFLVDLTAVDWAEGATPRFTIIYHLLSTTTHQYVRLAADCLDNEAPSVPSITSLWPSANWHERETFDMFGIQFTSHPDLRRILMWDGYPYHPLRKEFPLAGIETELPDVEVAAETKVKVKAAPMAGGPFVALSGQVNMTEAEPMAKDQSWTEKSEKPE